MRRTRFLLLAMAIACLAACDLDRPSRAVSDSHRCVVTPNNTVECTPRR